jgi:hypothetical protein
MVIDSHSTDIFGGHVITGAILSSTEMLWTHELELPQSSVALQVLLIVLSCGQAPPTVASVKVTIGDVSQWSVAVALPVLEGKVLAVQVIVTFTGQVITGGVASERVII